MLKVTILDHQAGETFYQAYGRAAIAWNKLEHELCVWFGLLLHGPIEVAEAIFYSAKSFQGKSSLIEEVIAAGKPSKDISSEEIAFLKKALRKAVQFNTFRNTIAHGVPYAGKRTDSLALATGRSLKSLGTAELIEAETLELAAQNFISLQQVLRRVFVHSCGHEGGMPPEEGLQQLLRLPTRADHRATAPKSAKPPRKPRSSRA